LLKKKKEKKKWRNVWTSTRFELLKILKNEGRKEGKNKRETLMIKGPKKWSNQRNAAIHQC